MVFDAPLGLYRAMFTFPVLFDSTLLAVVALPLAISLVRFALRRGRVLLPFDVALFRRRNLAPHVVASTSQHGETSERETDIPVPPYLASSVNDDELIGGSHIHLPPRRGPTGISFTFCVFTPPSFDKEIPKVDFYGVINFVRTGKVRHFVPRGSLRLLVINLREMTLSVYAPKQVKKKKQKKNSMADRGKLFADDESNGVRTGKKIRRSSGINICTTSTRNLMNTEFDVDEQGPDKFEEVSEDAWNSRHFESKPAIIHRLDDLVSVAALPPRHGGVIEIMSRLRTPSHHKSKGENPLFEDSDKKKFQNSKHGQNGNGRRTLSKKKKRSLQHPGYGDTNQTEKWPSGIEHSNCILDHVEISPPNSSPYTGAEMGIKASSKDKHVMNEIVIKDHRDEFAFRTPRDAAEFQRIIMVLRTVGREISHLYETLEAIQTSAEIQPGETQQLNETANMVVPPGVVLEDAWHCLKEMTSVRKCLCQFRLLSRTDDEHDHIFPSDSNGIREANNLDNHQMLIKNEFTQSDHKKTTLLGLVDFFSLFVPPLSTKDSHAVPCFTPCAKSDSIMFGRDTDLMLNRGIEWHYERLRFVSALQRRVSRAALYVRTYAWARVISHNGWRLDDVDDRGDSNGQTSDEVVSHREEPQNVSNESAYHNEVANGGEDVDAIGLESGTISNSSLWSPPLINNDHQGYSCVGWYAFRSSPSDETSNRAHNSKVWLRPDADPLDCIPSLRQVVEKYPYAHFFIFSYYSEQIGIAVYFLFVRSLPVGVDRAFDSIMSSFAESCAKERDESLGVSLYLGPGNGSSLVSKVTFRAILLTLCHEFTRAAIKFTPRKEDMSQMTSLSEFLSCHLASLWHYGGSLQKRDNLPRNYAAVNSQFRFNKIPKGIIGGFIVDFACGVKAFSNSLVPERAITSIGMANIDLKCVTTAPWANNAENRISAENVVGTRPNPMDDSCNPEVSADPTHETALGCHDQYPEAYHDNTDTILELLDGMSVPSRKMSQIRGEHNPDNQGEIITTEEVPLQLTRSDVERYFIACESDIKSTVVRIVESAAWRGLTFPIDQRSCRVELQSAQFFQQGFDKQSNPIFYFRNKLQAPWRNDIHATVLAVLHRLETFVLKAECRRPNVKITLIAFVGCPSCPIANGHGQTKMRTGKKRDVGEDEQPTNTPNLRPPSLGSDPRIDPYEVYHTHSNFVLIHLLNDLIPRHYPGRLAYALVVPDKANTKTRLRTLFPSQFQSHITILNSGDELKKYVNKDQLVTFAGGHAKVTSDAFQCDDSYNHNGA